MFFSEGQTYGSNEEGLVAQFADDDEAHRGHKGADKFVVVADQMTRASLAVVVVVIIVVMVVVVMVVFPCTISWTLHELLSLLLLLLNLLLARRLLDNGLGIAFVVIVFSLHLGAFGNDVLELGTEDQDEEK